MYKLVFWITRLYLTLYFIISIVNGQIDWAEDDDDPGECKFL